MNKIIKHIIRNNKIYFFGVVALLLLLMTRLKRLGFDGSFEAVGIQENQYISDLKAIDSIFHENQKVFIEVIPKADAMLKTIVSDMDFFEKKLKQEFDTIAVRSVIQMTHFFYTRKKIKKTTAQKALDKFSKIEVFKDLVSKDKKSFLVILNINDGTPKEIVEKIKTAGDLSHFASVQKINITSKFHIENSINNVLVHDLGKIILSILIGFVLIMILTYRSGFAIFYMMVIVTLSLLATFFVFQQFGTPFNLITLMVLPVVIVLSVADGIHLLTGLSHEDKVQPIETRIENVYKKYSTPSLLTSITTAVAFFTLSFNATTSVVHLGQIAGISILVSFLICYLVSPFIFKKWYRPSQIYDGFFKVAHFFQKRIKLFTYLLLPLIFIAIFLLPRLQFKNDFEIFLPLNSETKLQHDEIKDHYYSQAAIELTFRLNDILEKKQILKKITQSIEKVKGVNVVRSTQTSNLVKGKFLLPIDISKRSGYKRIFETENGAVQRLQVWVDSPNEIPMMENEIRKILENNKISEIRLTSPALIFSFVNKEVAGSLILSLLFSTIFLLLVFYFLTSSVIQALIGMIANIVPLSVIFILFVVFDLHINIVTAVTAVICLGLIVDDTIHAFYRRLILNRPLEELGFGMLTTTIILVTGFGLFAMSSIKPIIIFGLVSVVVFIITLISDFTLLFYFLKLHDDYLDKKNTT